MAFPYNLEKAKGPEVDALKTLWTAEEARHKNALEYLTTLASGLDQILRERNKKLKEEAQWVYTLNTELVPGYYMMVATTELDIPGDENWTRLMWSRPFRIHNGILFFNDNVSYQSKSWFSDQITQRVLTEEELKDTEAGNVPKDWTFRATGHRLFGK